MVAANPGMSAPPGQRFGGWTDGTNTYQPGQTLRLTRNLTLTPVWVAPTPPGRLSSEAPVETTSPEENLLITGDTNFTGTLAGPLHGTLAGGTHWALLNLLLTIGALLLAPATWWFGRHHNLYPRRDNNYVAEQPEPLTYERFLNRGYAQLSDSEKFNDLEDQQVVRRSTALRELVAGVLAALSAALVWILTQVITGRWVWVDRWSLLFAALFAVVLTAYVHHRFLANQEQNLQYLQDNLEPVG
jgi:hypothetical protein